MQARNKSRWPQVLVLLLGMILVGGSVIGYFEWRRGQELLLKQSKEDYESLDAAQKASREYRMTLIQNALREGDEAKFKALLDDEVELEMLKNGSYARYRDRAGLVPMQWTDDYYAELRNRVEGMARDVVEVEKRMEARGK